jgi:DNA-binding LacI/PurR family transcriptional regulator
MSATHTESPPETRTRLTDVAREAGVSLSTASRALRGEAGVRGEMADRVRKAAMAVGYARRTREGKHPRPTFGSKPVRVARVRASDRVVVLTPASHVEALAVPKLLEGVALTLRGAALDPVFTEDAADLPPPAPRGAIAIHITDKVLRAALDSYARVVNVGHVPGGKADAVVADDFGGMHGVVSGALALGHRRVAVVTGPSGHSSSRARKRAVVAALDEEGLARANVTWREAGWSIEGGHEAAASILSSKSPPTLVVCSHDLQALGVGRAAREKGLRVPLDLSITGFGGIAAGPGFRLTITSARADPYAMGVVAAERLIELLGRPSGPPRTIVLPTVPVPGQTLAVPRRR